jgi:hypothetical protein
MCVTPLPDYVEMPYYYHYLSCLPADFAFSRICVFGCRDCATAVIQSDLSDFFFDSLETLDSDSDDGIVVEEIELDSYVHG